MAFDIRNIPGSKATVSIEDSFCFPDDVDLILYRYAIQRAGS